MMYFNNHTSIYIKYDEVLHGNIYFTTKILGPVHAPPTFENATPLIIASTMTYALYRNAVC